MKEYKIVTETHWYSTEKLRRKTEQAINDFALLGWEVVSISFSSTSNGAVATFITLSRDSAKSNYV